MGRNPLVRLQLSIRPPSRIWSRSSNLERRRTLLPSLDDLEGCATPFGDTEAALQSAPAPPPNTAVASTTELSQAVAQVAEAVREVKARTSQRVRVCDHLDPMDRLEVEPRPGTLESQLRQAQGWPAARRLGVYDGTACRHARPSGYPSPGTLLYVDFARPTPYGRRVQMALCWKAPQKLADGSATLELLPGLRTTTRGPLAGACAAYYGFLIDTSKETRPREGQEVAVVRPQALENHQEPSVNSLLPTTTRGGCSSARTKPVVSAWPWLELPGFRGTKPSEALLTHSIHRCRKSSTQSRAKYRLTRSCSAHVLAGFEVAVVAERVRRPLYRV